MTARDCHLFFHRLEHKFQAKIELRLKNAKNTRTNDSFKLPFVYLMKAFLGFICRKNADYTF